MATVSVNSGVGLAMQTAAATPIAITSITLADPAVITHGGADPEVGEFVLIRNVAGVLDDKERNPLNGRIFRVASVDSVAGTFTIEAVGLDISTGYTAHTAGSGTFEVITFDQSLTIVDDLASNGGEPVTIEKRALSDTQGTLITTGFNGVNVEATVYWAPDDPGFQALAANSGKSRGFRKSYQDGRKECFFGEVQFVPQSGGAKGEIAINQSPATVALAGLSTAFAS